MKILPTTSHSRFPQSLFIFLLLFAPIGLLAQIETFWIDTTTHADTSTALFFTNRPVKINSKSGSFEFKNKSTKETDNLFFCLYDYALDSIFIKYRAYNPGDPYPVEKVENNILYKIYDDLRIKKGIRKFSITIPGYSHTFKDQVSTFMRRMKVNYGDSVQNTAALILYAWGDEWRPYRYYRAKSSAQRGANDFAIFQHMLEDFLSDSVFFSTHPKDFDIYLTCTSMGNQLLKEYLLEREKQGIPLTRVYKSILFIGSDASWDSFEPGKGFHNIGQMCDSVRVIWHDKDLPLKASKTANFRKRMGLYGPMESENLPPCVTSHYIGDMLTEGDKSAGYHDYMLSNPDFQKLLLDGLKEDKE
jgi:hypothetical protein